MDSVFLNLNRGNRITSYMGLELPQGQPPRFLQPNYFAVEVGVDSSEFDTEKLLRNQHVFIPALCRVTVRADHHLLVEPNSALSEYGQVQGNYYIHPGDGERVPGFWITLRKDLLLSDIQYAVRLYLQV